MQAVCHCFKSHFILMRYYFYLVFIFWDICYDSASIAGMEAEEEALRQNFFICLRVYEQKNKINFDERPTMKAGMKALSYFS